MVDLTMVYSASLSGLVLGAFGFDFGLLAEWIVCKFRFFHGAVECPATSHVFFSV